MMTEDLLVKLRLDVSDMKRQMGTVEKMIEQSFSKSTKSAATSSAAMSASMVELRDTMEDIRGLQFFDLFVNGVDKIKSKFTGLKDLVKDILKDTKGDLEHLRNVFIGWTTGRDPFAFQAYKFRDVWEAAGDAAKMAIMNVGIAIRNVGEIIGSILDSTAMKVAGFVATVAGLFAGVKNAIGTAGLMKSQYYEASSLGLSISQYKEWTYIFESVGETADDLADAIKTLSSEQAILAEGSEGNRLAFEALGLSVAQVTNMSQEELFKETVSRLQQVEDQVKRTTLAYTIFGEDTAARLTNVLKLNNEEMRKMSENFYLLGGGVSEAFTQKSLSLASALKSLKTAWTGLTNTLAELFMPVVQKVVEWLTKAIVVVNLFLKTVFNLDIAAGIGDVGAAIGGVGNYTDSVEEATGAVEKLKRVTMGFDELNIVTNPNSSAGSGASGGGASGGIDGGALDTSNSVFTKAQEQIEAFQEKVRAFMEEWKTELAIIGAALGVLGVAGLIDSLGQALGLGEKFHALMTNIRKLAGTAIVMTLQYSFVNEFMDNFIDGKGIKEYIKGLLVAALGTAVLYAMWGPAGLVLGLGVTAAASFKAVIDNGGITNIESAVVALTGLATGIGAVMAAVKVFNLGKVFGDIGAFFALLKEGNGLLPTLAAAFPRVSSAITGIGTAMSGAAGAIGAVFGLTGTAAVTAGAAVIVAAIVGIISVIKFLKEHWDEVGQAAKNFFDQNIAPKLDGIKESFSNIGKALGPVGKAIGDIISKIGEWLKSIDWLDSIGKAFEVIGGVIFAAVSGVIAGAINTLVGMWESSAKAIEGAVKIISGAIELVVKLFTLDLEGAKTACKKIFDGIVDLFEGLYGFVVNPIKNFVQGVIDWFVKLWDELVGHSVVPDMMDDIVECFKELPERVYKWLKELAAGVIKRFTDMWNNVVQGCKTKLGEARTAVINGWNNIKSYFTSNIAPKFTLDYWKNKFDTMRSAIQTKLGEVRTQVMNSWNAIRSYFTTNIAPKFTLEYWKNKFDTVRSAASTKFNEVRTTCMNAWNNIKSWFNTNVKSKFTVSFWTGKFNTIKDGAKAAFNGVISVVESAVNGIIKKINTLSWEIPDWVPKYGGDEFGFSLKQIKIPRLAQGGITNGSTLANIGENGREAVLPLENNTGWMDALADRLASRMNPATKVILKVDERELGHATIHAINQNTKQTGGLQLQLV